MLITSSSSVIDPSFAPYEVSTDGDKMKQESKRKKDSESMRVTHSNFRATVDNFNFIKSPFKNGS